MSFDDGVSLLHLLKKLQHGLTDVALQSTIPEHTDTENLEAE